MSPREEARQALRFALRAWLLVALVTGGLELGCRLLGIEHEDLCTEPEGQVVLLAGELEDEPSTRHVAAYGGGR